MKKHILVYLFFLPVFGIAQDAFIDGIATDIATQFEYLIDYNEQNIKEGNSEKNVYFLVYDAKKRKASLKKENIILAEEYFEYLKMDSQSQYFDVSTIDSIKNKLNVFNQSTNNFGLKFYGLILQNLELAIQSYFLETTNESQNVLNHLTEISDLNPNNRLVQKNKEEYRVKIDSTITAKLNSKNAGDKTLIRFAYVWSSKYWKKASNRKRVKVWWTQGWTGGDTAFKENHTLARKNYRDSRFVTRTDYPFSYSSDKKLYNAFASDIEYLSSTTIQEQFNVPCAELLVEWAGHPMVSNENHPYYDIIMENPCALNNMALDAFSFDNLENLVAVEGSPCLFEVKEEILINQTTEGHDANYNEYVEKFSSKLASLIINAPEKGEYVNKSANLTDAKQAILDDKFRAYKEYVGKQIFVVNLPIPFYMTEDDINNFANDVAIMSSTYFDPSTMLFVCVPYFEWPRIRDNSGNCGTNAQSTAELVNHAYTFPAYVGYQSDLAGVGVNYEANISSVLNAYRDTNFELFCYDFYKNIPKPYVPVVYILHYNGIIEEKVDMDEIPEWAEESAYVTGHSSIAELVYLYDKERITEYRDVLFAIQEKKTLIANMEAAFANGNPDDLESVAIDQYFTNSASLHVDYKQKKIIEDKPPNFERYKIRLKESWALKIASNNRYYHQQYGYNILKDIYEEAWFIDNINYDISEALFPADYYDETQVLLGAASAIAYMTGHPEIALFFEAGGVLHAVYHGQYMDAALNAAFIGGTIDDTVIKLSGTVAFSNIATNKWIVRQIGNTNEWSHHLVASQGFKDLLLSKFALNDALATALHNSDDMIRLVRNKTAMDIMENAAPEAFGDAFFQYCKDYPNFLEDIATNANALEQYVALVNIVPDAVTRLPNGLLFDMLHDLKIRKGFKEVLENATNNTAENLIDLYTAYKSDPAIGDFLKGLDTESFVQHFEDLSGNLDLIDVFLEDIRLVKAWEALKNTVLRTDVDLWLPTVSKWLNEGVTFVDDVLPVKFLHNGDEIARIVDDKLVPTKFQFDGTVINEVKLPGQTFGKDVVKASDGTIGFRYQFQKTKIYRAMSDAEWQAVQNNNGLSIGSGTENFVSTSKAYSEGYIGQPGYDVLVEFTVQPKTVQDLAKIGVKDQSNLIKNSGFDDLTPVSSGWSSTKALFKGEGTAVNIGLGAESANTFNGNISNFVRLN